MKKLVFGFMLTALFFIGTNLAIARTPVPAITSPTNGSTLMKSSQEFIWDYGALKTRNVYECYLMLGTTPLGDDIYISPDLKAATRHEVVDSIPMDGNVVYVTLRYNMQAAGWCQIQTSYKTCVHADWNVIPIITGIVTSIIGGLSKDDHANTCEDAKWILPVGLNRDGKVVFGPMGCEGEFDYWGDEDWFEFHIPDGYESVGIYTTGCPDIVLDVFIDDCAGFEANFNDPWMTTELKKADVVIIRVKRASYQSPVNDYHVYVQLNKL